MLKAILGTDPIRENDLTPSALMRVRASSIAALLCIPLITTLDVFNVFEPMNDFMKLAVTGFALLIMSPFMFNRINSIFIRSKKNLDEWELRARTDAQSFSYRAIGLILVLTFLSIILFSNFDLDALSFGGESVFRAVGNLLLLTMFLPSAYVVWTQKPLNKGEDLGDRSEWVI